MIAIEKQKYYERERTINLKFLKDCFNEDEKAFIPKVNDPSSFDNFCRTEYRKVRDGWLDLLLEEQSYLCCYCMRRLKKESGSVNIEHVIPKSLSGDVGRKEYQYYISKAPILGENVEMADCFEVGGIRSKVDVEKIQKFPHITALANLTVACNGVRNSKNRKGCCCNNKRGEKRILPLMLMEQPSNMVRYDQNGLLLNITQDENLKTIIEELNSETYQEMRFVWRTLSEIDLNVEDLEKMELKDRISLFKQAFNVDDFNELEMEVKKFVGLNDDFYWNFLNDYNWFYDYYRNNVE